MDNRSESVCEWSLRQFRGEKLARPRTPFPFERAPAPTFVLEIGSGNGLHALHFARKNPHRQIVAVERTVVKSRKARNAKQRWEQQEPLPNLHLVHDDVVNFLYHYVKQPVLEAVFILYPNPYPKTAQRNKRFPFMPFLSHLSHCMLPGAPLVLATNEPTYFAEGCAQLPQYFDLALLRQEILDPRCEPRTHFEKTFFEQKVLCYQATFVKGAPSGYKSPEHQYGEN